MWFKKKKKTNGHDTKEEDSTAKEQIESSFLERLQVKFKYSKHRVIERKIRAFVIAAALLFSGMAMSVIEGHFKNLEKAKETTPYGTSISFSKTNAKLTYDKPMISKDFKTAYIPFSINDMGELSTNSNDYKLFIQAESGELTYSPTGQFVLFGETGRGAIILHSSMKIKNQPVRIYIRNDKNLSKEKRVSDVESTSKNALTQARNKYDILFFTVNPNANDIPISEDLSTKEINVTTLYKTLFANNEVTAIKDAIKEDVEEIEHQKQRVEELRERLKRNGYSVPNNPQTLNDNWKPKNALSIDIDSNLEQGFIKDEVKVKEELSDVAQDNVTSDTEVFDQALKRDDGTLSSDTVNSGDVSNGNSASEMWSELQKTWGTIEKTKKDIYVNQAKKLYNVQRDVDRQNSISSISDADRFSILGK